MTNKELPFGLSAKELKDTLNQISTPPGEKRPLFLKRIVDMLRKLEQTGNFKNINEAIGIAQNWARQTPQTDAEVRQGILDERRAREEITNKRLGQEK